ncbi:MBL fold metallo-hydrolase [Antrihabitans stalactiti]|uniref:MBL fold metallo-hydrolase n=1 Tax=Antrihabitans stalactiti TaxID=2584121 RepID=A0A848KLZ7_9NOCA|nr:MBL fold metallo-hydrolase [Antrihabitans stalactiti]NMN98876.1 MBL fold metallo-hydrolase [Antrihabitans stalactiti]
MDFSVTHIGGPTALLEIGGVRILTDPTFDPPGKLYHFGWGTFSRKVVAPAIAVGDIGRIDAVLLSHDGHADNLDDVGRTVLPAAGKVVTTTSAAKRLGGNAVGLEPWATTTVDNAGTQVRITATPGRHGPPLSRPIVGQVIGFLLEWDGQEHGPVWITGDTVYFDGVSEIATRYNIGTALLHIGGVRFPYLSGPIRYTMNAAEAVRVAREFDLKTILPVHYEGWTHFRQGRDVAEAEFADAGIGDRVHWLVAGEPLHISS